VIEKIVALHSSRDWAISEPGVATLRTLGQAGCFDALLAAHTLAWKQLWEMCDIGLEDPFLLPPPAAIKGITFDPGDPSHVLASGEGGILQSRNNGATWTRPLGDVDYRFYFQTVFDPQDARIIYTASWAKEFELPQPLVFEISTDSGASWAAYRLNEPGLFGGAWSVSAVVEDGRTVVYLGLFLGGIMKVLLPPDGD
jgi:hypothetical protein